MSEESFGLQCPPPWMHLKRILANYPEGTSVFKEALQNADDAGARNFKIILDYRKLDDLANESFPERFAGPSLIFYNDGVFTDADWSSLRTMFQSHKLEADCSGGKDGSTYIGKYGMGSRSFFHMTDLLMAVSNETYAYIDPNEMISKAGGGKVIFTKHSTTTKSQRCSATTGAGLIPLRALKGVEGFDQSRAYDGTLFRLPLRQGADARASRFAPYEYDVDKTLRLIKLFASELGDCLLLLNHFSNIELLAIDEKPEEPRLIKSCKLLKVPCSDQSVSSLNFREINWTERTTERKEEKRSTVSSRGGFSDALVKMIFSEDGRSCPLNGSGYSLSKNLSSEIVEACSYWLVCENRDLDSVLKIKPLNSSQPVIGVALKLFPEPKVKELGIFSDDFNDPGRKSDDLDLYCWPTNDVDDYQLFNYLPIPDAVSTGLPFHVHGSFHLTENRRDLWMSTEAEGLAELWSEWNRSLLLKALPNLMATIFRKHFIKERNENNRNPLDVTAIYRFWPDPAKLPNQLKPISANMMAACCEQITELKNARFLRLADTTVSALLELKALWSTAPGSSCGKDGLEQSSEQQQPDLAGMLQSLSVITSRSSKEFICAAPQRFYSAFPRANYMSFLTSMYHHVLPHWLNNVGFNQLVLREKYFVPWMYILCQTLSACNVDEIQRFAPKCRTLRFVPCRAEQHLPALGVMPDEDWIDECAGNYSGNADNVPLTQVTLRAKNHEWILLQPAAVYDASLKTFRVTTGGIPAGPFSTPGVSRVLRSWGMKPTLSWTDMTQELVLRICQNNT